MEYNPSDLVASNQQNKKSEQWIVTYDGNSATYANEGSKPMEDYCSIKAFAE